MYLEKINSPKDIKKLSIDELKELIVELRAHLLKRLSEKGGHIGPNLGSLEFTVALHYVFDSPKDKIVFDVSHQTYVHKMLTGRKDAFMIPEKYSSVTGYTSPKESEHDFFTIGHTSTSISLACGLAKARNLKGDNENIIAVIGDGSLSGGEAYEGLNNVFELDSNMIVVINDNIQSIAENHGGIYKNLFELRKTKGKAENNIFKAMGLNYIYVDEGNDIEELISAFKSVKNIGKPIVVHLSTNKGNGFKPAEINKEDFHFLDSIVRQSLKSPLNKVYIKPNFLALILGEIEKGKKLVDTGYSQSRIDSMKSQVMDIALEKKAKEKGLTIVGLEGIFDAFVSEKSNLKKEADELISDLREDDEISPLSFVNTLSDVYRTQNMKSLIDFEVKVDSIFRTSPKLTEIGKRIREDLLKRRNLNWMNKIPELMKAQPTFIAVGVRHLPGKDGLIALLLEKGYQVEPIGL